MSTVQKKVEIHIQIFQMQAMEALIAKRNAKKRRGKTRKK